MPADDLTEVTIIQWGCRYDEEFVQRVHDEAMARKIARMGKSLGHVPVRRVMTIGPWEVVPDAVGPP